MLQRAVSKSSKILENKIVLPPDNVALAESKASKKLEKAIAVPPADVAVLHGNVPQAESTQVT